jgi:ribosomal protein S6
MDVILKEYELAFLAKDEESAQAVFALLEKQHAVVSHKNDPSSIQLAYPIHKHTSALFGFCYFTASPEILQEINNALRINTSIIRFLLLTPPVKPYIRQEKVPKVQEPNKRPESPAISTSILSNEDLEQKLEEILK